MSEEQLSALLAKLKGDAGLREKLQGAGDLDAALTLAKEAGFDVSKADWLNYQANQTMELSDDELEEVAGGAAACVHQTKNTPDFNQNKPKGQSMNCFTGARQGCPP